MRPGAGQQAFGVVTLVRGPGIDSGSPRPVICMAVLTRARLLWTAQASLFPIIAVLSLALAASALVSAEQIKSQVTRTRTAAAAAAAGLSRTWGPAAAATGGRSSDPWGDTPLKEAADGSRAVLPLVAFLLLSLRGLLRTPPPRVFLPPPLGTDPASGQKSTTRLPLAWGLASGLAGECRRKRTAAAAAAAARILPYLSTLVPPARNARHADCFVF